MGLPSVEDAFDPMRSPKSSAVATLNPRPTGHCTCMLTKISLGEAACGLLCICFVSAWCADLAQVRPSAPWGPFHRRVVRGLHHAVLLCTLCCSVRGLHNATVPTAALCAWEAVTAAAAFSSPRSHRCLLALLTTCCADPVVCSGPLRSSARTRNSAILLDTERLEAQPQGELAASANGDLVQQMEELSTRRTIVVPAVQRNAEIERLAEAHAL